MQMFILGIIQGIGLVLMVRELNIQWLMHKERKQRRLIAAQNQAIGLLRECTCWSGRSAPLADHAYYCQLNDEVQA
jgi:hypothetical protein